MEGNKFEVGQKVRVIPEPPYSRTRHLPWIDVMNETCGKLFIVIKKNINKTNLFRLAPGELVYQLNTKDELGNMVENYYYYEEWLLPVTPQYFKEVK